MAWIRLSDDYNDHPKIDNLSDGAFRLWHQAMGFCRKFHTDGFMPIGTVRKLKAFSPKRMTELLTPWKAGEHPLWHESPEGITVHDYLDWNLSKAEEQIERDGTRERVRVLRQKQRCNAVTPPVTDTVTWGVSNGDVPGRDGKEALKKELSPENRAGRLREDLYPRWYSEHRHGAKLALFANSLEFNEALRLVGTWDDARLEKLAKIVLTTDDPWISRTDRGFKIFAMKATWADEKLSAWEHEHQVKA